METETSVSNDTAPVTTAKRLRPRTPQVTTSPTFVEKDAARYINLSVAWLRVQRRDGGGPAFLRIGRAIRYRVQDLDAWLASRRVAPRESR